MSGRNVAVVIVPRFTTYVGGGTYETIPIPVSAYDGLVVSVWRGALIGTVPTLSLGFLESNDLENWSACAGTVVPPGAGSEAQSSVSFTKAWFRMNTVLASADSGVTMWAQGFFTLREK